MMTKDQAQVQSTGDVSTLDEPVFVNCPHCEEKFLLHDNSLFTLDGNVIVCKVVCTECSCVVMHNKIEIGGKIVDRRDYKVLESATAQLDITKDRISNVNTDDDVTYIKERIGRIRQVVDLL